MFSKPRKAIGIDIGSHSVKTIQMGRAGSRSRIEQVGYALIDRNQANVDPIAAQATAVREALGGMPVEQSLLVGALPGQTVVIRYPRLPEMPRDQLGRAIEAEAGQSIPYDLSEVFIDWDLLDKVREGEKTKLKVLLVAAKYDVIETRVQIADNAGIRYGVLGVDSLALADAAESCELLGPDETVALVNLGLNSTSIHFMKGGASNFIRDVTWGAREMVQAIAKGRRCDLAEAEAILVQSSGEDGPATEMPPPLPESEPAPPPEEPEPAPEPAPVPGVMELGSSLLDPLGDELGGLGDPIPAPTAPLFAANEADKSLEELLALPLARLVSEIRRSFDFYEQQLYERPVERLILSGGVAHMPALRRTLAEELGLERVDVADPSESALALADAAGLDRLRERPAQFMVAVGLAARGMSQL